MHARRGFTLVEVLVALGLLVVISSLALPVALTNTESARALTAQRVLTLSPGVARAGARRLGRPVAMVLAPSEDGQSLRLLIVREPEPGGEDAADQRADPDDVSTWPAADEPRPLPRGTRLWEGPIDRLEAFEAQQDAAAAPDAGSPLDMAFMEDGAADGPAGGLAEPPGAVVLAWYLSDGTTVAGRATVVRLADGRVVRVRVEPLAGRVLFTPAPELEAGPGGADEQMGGQSGEQPGGPEADPDGQRPAGGSGSGSRSRSGGGRGNQPEAMAFDALEFDRPEFERPQFDRPEFGALEFEERQFDARQFDAPEFDALEFDSLEFDELGFDPLGFDSDDPDARPERDEPAEAAEPRPNPEPPQPR